MIRAAFPLEPCAHPHAADDFQYARGFLANLETELPLVSPSGAAELRALLEDRGYSFRALQETLSKAIPNVISVAFCPTRSENHAHAAVQDIIDKLRRSRRPSFLSHLEARATSRRHPSAVGDQILRRIKTIPRLCSTSRWHSSRTYPAHCRRTSQAEASLSLDDRISLVVEMGAEASNTPRAPSSSPPPSASCCSSADALDTDATPTQPPPPTTMTNKLSRSTLTNSSSSSYAQLTT